MRLPSFEIGANIRNHEGKKNAIFSHTLKLNNFEETSYLIENITSNDAQLKVSLASCIMNQCSYNFPFLLT